MSIEFPPFEVSEIIHHILATGWESDEWRARLRGQPPSDLQRPDPDHMWAYTARRFVESSEGASFRTASGIFRPPPQEITLPGFLNAPVLNRDGLISHLETYPLLRDQWDVVVVMSEKQTLRQHTANVLRQFERYFRDADFPHPITRPFMRLFLALHDSGKARAVLEKRVKYQHDYIEPIMNDVLEKNGMNPRLIVLAKTLLRNKVSRFIAGIRQIYRYLELVKLHEEEGPHALTWDLKTPVAQRLEEYARFIQRDYGLLPQESELVMKDLNDQRDGNRFGDHLIKRAYRDIYEQAAAADMPPMDYLNLGLMYHQVDAGAYTTDATDGYQLGHRSAFDDMFHFDRSRGRMTYNDAILGPIDDLGYSLEKGKIFRANHFGKTPHFRSSLVCVKVGQMMKK